MESNPIVITGEGIVCAIGNDCASVASSLVARRSGIGEMRFLPSAHHELPVGEVKLSNAEMKQRLHINADQTMSRTALMGIMAVREALTKARIQSAAHKRVLLISGTTVAGMDVTEQAFLRTAGQPAGQNAAVDFIAHHDCGSNTADIADYFHLFTDYTTISTACSSAANALLLGAEMLKAGDADIVVAGGSEALSLFHLNGFNSLMILDHERCRPFDGTRAGLNLGEGAAYVVMERLDDAVARHATADACLAGYGNACDAFHQTASSPEGIGAQLAMRQALDMAGLKPKDVQWVHAHGTGTVNNDQSEARAIRQVFQDHLPAVSSTKSFTGHTTSASGSIAAVISIIAMHHRFIPVNLGWRLPMEDADALTAEQKLAENDELSSLRPYMGQNEVMLHTVMCNSFGFGGNDTSLLLTDKPIDVPPTTLIDEQRIVEVSSVVNDKAETAAAVKQYVKPMEARRMGTLLRSTMLTSLQALQQANISEPDAIVTGTAWGCINYSEQLLQQLMEGEDLLKPTLFMQSTHNTLSSAIAIHLKCHGYNITFSQNNKSWAWSLYQARLLLRLGRCKSVLVGCHDESTQTFNELLRRMGKRPAPEIQSRVSVLRMM